MKHQIINKQSLGNHIWLVNVQLLPDSNFEKESIKKAEIAEANEVEKELIDNYLLFNLGLGNYSVVNYISQKNTLFSLKVYI